MDLRTTFSDGTHTIEETVLLARSRGFRVVFFNDHDRIALRYGLPPFRDVFRYKKEYPSIMTHTPERYLSEIKRVAAKYPDMILVPGCITSPFYYWSGSWLKGDLTVHQYDRRVLILSFENPEDYARLPNVGNRLSIRYARQSAPAAALFLGPLALGLLLVLRWRGLFRISGAVILALSCLALADANPFRSSPYSPYDGDQGIAPFQEVLDFVNERGGLVLGAFERETPFEVEVVDRDLPTEQMTYYRLMDSRKHLTSNPIFVQYKQWLSKILYVRNLRKI